MASKKKPSKIEKLRAERDAWRQVVEDFMGDYVNGHTPEECQDELMRRAVHERESDSEQWDELLRSTCRVVAEKQREACARALKGTGPGNVRKVRAVPLVGEQDNSSWEQLVPNGWKRITPAACDICDETAIWAHPLGGLRCGNCPKPWASDPMYKVVT